jgi:SnoaL-like domain
MLAWASVRECPSSVLGALCPSPRRTAAAKIPRGAPTLPVSKGCGCRYVHNRAVESSEIVAELWSRIEARDWDGVGEQLADDFVLEWPNARIRLRGRTSFVEFNRSYPEGWSIEVLRIVAEGNTAVSEVRVPHPTVGP